MLTIAMVRLSNVVSYCQSIGKDLYKANGQIQTIRQDEADSVRQAETFLDRVARHLFRQYKIL